MKKAFKLFFVYLGVLILALIATVVFCGAFLFFYREGDIFGIKYISTNEIIQAVETDSMSGLNKIKVNGNDFTIQISVNSSVKTLKGAMQNKVFGYTYKDRAQAKFTLNYNKDTKTAVFDVKEPSGWISRKSAYIQIAIPKDLAKDGFDLEVVGDKADINIFKGEDELNIDNLIVNSSRGDVKLDNVNIVNSIITNIGKGEFVVSNSCTTSNPIDAIISVGNGDIDFGKTNTMLFNLGVVEIKKSGHGEIAVMKCDKLITNGNIESGGKIYVNEVKFVDFSSKDTDLVFGKITYIDSSRIKLSGYGDVKIKMANCPLEIETHNGSIDIGTCTGKMILKANQGDILVSEALGYISANSAYGKIGIVYSKNANGYNTSNQHRAVQATTKNGLIDIYGLENGVITATDKGRINLTYNKIVGDNVVEAKQGTVNIVVPSPQNEGSNEYAFNLKVETQTPSDIKVGVAGDIGNVNSDASGVLEFNNIYNSQSSTSNNLSVTSSVGMIKIRSSDLVGF